MPWADKLYGCDARWWLAHDGVPDFQGEKWSTHHKGVANDKSEVADRFGINLVRGNRAQYGGFSLDPGVIHYGDNSGFQGLTMAVLLGSPYIVLVGFNMGGRGHFFGDHPPGLHNQEDYSKWVPEFDHAAKKLPEGVKIINATPESALLSFTGMNLDDAIENYRLHSDGSEPDTRSG